MMGGIYVYVGAEANIDQVAVDLRNQAPNVLVVCCSDEDAAARMATALSAEVVNKQTRGDGGLEEVVRISKLCSFASFSKSSSSQGGAPW